MDSSAWDIITEQNFITELICKSGITINSNSLKSQVSYFSNIEELNNSVRSNGTKKIGDKSNISDYLKKLD